MVAYRKPVRMSLARQVLEEMERCIRDGVWPLGGKIPPEPELVRSFGVSRNTVREAVQSLIHAGMLEARPGDGTYVLASDRLEVVIKDRLRSAELSKILEARLALEKEIARLAAVNRTEADLRLLEQRLRERNNCDNRDPEADLKFHAAVAAATHNPILAELYEIISQYLQVIMRMWLAANRRNEAEIQVHNELAAAIGARDPERAEQLIHAIIRFDSAMLPAEKGQASV